MDIWAEEDPSIYSEQVCPTTTTMKAGDHVNQDDCERTSEKYFGS